MSVLPHWWRAEVWWASCNLCFQMELQPHLAVRAGSSIVATAGTGESQSKLPVLSVTAAGAESVGEALSARDRVTGSRSRPVELVPRAIESSMYSLLEIGAKGHALPLSRETQVRGSCSGRRKGGRRVVALQPVHSRRTHGQTQTQPLDEPTTGRGPGGEKKKIEPQTRAAGGL